MIIRVLTVAMACCLLVSQFDRLDIVFGVGPAALSSNAVGSAAAAAASSAVASSSASYLSTAGSAGTGQDVSQSASERKAALSSGLPASAAIPSAERKRTATGLSLSSVPADPRARNWLGKRVLLTSKPSLADSAGVVRLSRGLLIPMLCGVVCRRRALCGASGRGEELR
jgi:hypothetical protein